MKTFLSILLVAPFELFFVSLTCPNRYLGAYPVRSHCDMTFNTSGRKEGRGNDRFYLDCEH